MALLSGSRLTHDLATSECLLLACRHAAITVGFKVIDRKRAIMMHMRVKRQHQRRTLLHQSNAHVAPAMNPTLVAFGTLNQRSKSKLSSGKSAASPPTNNPGAKLLITVANCC